MPNKHPTLIVLCCLRLNSVLFLFHNFLSIRSVASHYTYHVYAVVQQACVNVIAVGVAGEAAAVEVEHFDCFDLGISFCRYANQSVFNENDRFAVVVDDIVDACGFDNVNDFVHFVVIADTSACIGDYDKVYKIIDVIEPTGINNVIDDNSKPIIFVENGLVCVATKGNTKVKTIEVFDLNGRCLARNTNRNDIDASLLHNSVYMVRVVTGDGTYTQKIVK